MNNGNLSNADILAALGVLQSKYPHEKRVSFWVEFYPQGDYLSHEPGFRFVAIVGDSESDPKFGNGKTVSEALASVIEKAGDRDPKRTLMAKIEKTRSELAKLEAQLNPTPSTPTPDTETQPQPASV